MRVYLNDTLIEVPQDTILQNLLISQLNISTEKKGVAVAVNENIVPKNEWEKYTLHENDRILVIIAAQGG